MLFFQLECFATLYIHNYCPIQFNIQIYNTSNDTFIGISASNPGYYEFDIDMTDSSYIKIWPHMFWPVVTVGHLTASGFSDNAVYPYPVTPMTVPFMAAYTVDVYDLSNVIVLLIPEM